MTSLALTLLGISLPFDAAAGNSTHWRLYSDLAGDAVQLAAHEYAGPRGTTRTLTLATYGKARVRAEGRTWEAVEAELRDKAIKAGTYDAIAALTILGRAA